LLDAPTRIAHLLCELDFRMKAQGSSTANTVDLPLTQYQIAEATGLTPVHVNRTLKAMQARGLISVKSGNVRLPHWEELRSYSGFDVRYLHALSFRDYS
jgi:CRP-like cAMP-binding protein